MLNCSKKRMHEQIVGSVVRSLVLSLFVALMGGCGAPRPVAGPAPGGGAGPEVGSTTSSTADSASTGADSPGPGSAHPHDTAPWVAGGLAEIEVVRSGVDVLMESGYAVLAGKRVGLITNHTGLNRAGESTIDLLHHAPGVELVSLFSPEHGIRGVAGPGEVIESEVDSRTGLPIHSLYGATRKPTAEMMDGLDALVFDIQDIGTRYYTYIWTMALALEAAGGEGLEFVVLDRPNPLGGVAVQGGVLEGSERSFVGLYPVPMRHGMTVGEMALLLNGEYGLGAKLTVVPATGWQRSEWFDQTGLTWTAPSPNMPSLESAIHYPGSCLFEGTSLSVGRGTELAFQQIGAPWLENEELVERLRGLGVPGVAFEAVDFRPEGPGDGKFAGELVRGVRFMAVDREVYDPTMAALAVLIEIQRLHPDELAWRERHFDRLAGTARVREMVAGGHGVEEVVSGWGSELAEFRRVRSRYLIYR